ncbi:unnamed protein product [Symbiodinium sp. CCMP2592]|nr:unnamed protein product [Symbiodinium sp. CCMP2592]
MSDRGMPPELGREPLPSEYLLGSPKSQRSGRSGRSPSQRSLGSPKSGISSKAHRAWKAANPELEVLSVDELQKLLLLKDQALQLLHEEVEELQSSLRSQELMEVRYRHLQGLLQPSPGCEGSRHSASTMLDKIGEAGRAAHMNRLHAYHAGTSHGYTDFEAKAIAFPVDEHGLLKRGIHHDVGASISDSAMPRQQRSWLY